MSNVWLLIIAAVVSYFIGNINWALLISKFKKNDIRKLGSGNPGTLNMSRNFGLKIGLLTFFLDMMKGGGPALIAFFIFNGRGTFPDSVFKVSDFAIYLCGLSAVLGHIYPAVLKFKGGKGIASTIGVFLVCESVHGVGFAMVAVMAMFFAVAFIYLTEFGAMGSFIAITPPAVCGSIRMFVSYASKTASANTIVWLTISNMLIFAICFFTWFAHRKNIERMLAGDEHPTSIKEMVVKIKAKKKAEQEAAAAKSAGK